MAYDYSTAPEQRSNDLIPDGTVATLRRPFALAAPARAGSSNAARTTPVKCSTSNLWSSTDHG